jgi:hypothetical protein
VKQSLQRILRIRALLENLAHLEWEKKAGEARQLETSAAGFAKKARAVRLDALERLQGRDSDGTPSWMLSLADADMLAWQRAKLAQLAAVQKPAIQTARAEFLARRLDRRQVETLLESAAQAAAKEQKRREQKQVDDWYQSRPGMPRQAK